MSIPFLVKDINPGAFNSYPQSLTVVGNTLFFTAYDGVNGFELWKSDGTAAGTVLVKDIRPRFLLVFPPQFNGSGQYPVLHCQ
jgi:ELWxxDGT repeat protein